MSFIDLGSIPRTEAEALVKTGAPVYVFVNPIENHGPHLPLTTDLVISEGLAHLLHERLQQKGTNGPLLFYPPLALGVNPAPGVGSVFTRYLSLKEAVINLCRGLKSLGVKKVIFMTFHGDSFHNLAIQAGVDFLVDHGVRALNPFTLVLEQMLSYDSKKFEGAFDSIQDLGERKRIQETLSTDFHAGFFETSLVLFLKNESVSKNYTTLPSCPEVKPEGIFTLIEKIARRLGKTKLASECRFIYLATGWAKLKPFPGYTSSPHLASVEAGKFFSDQIGSLYVEKVFSFFENENEKPPEPIMKWVIYPTFNGRLL